MDDDEAPDAYEAASLLESVQRDMEARGISADMDVTFHRDGGGLAGYRALARNVRLRTGTGIAKDGAAQAAIESVARADPSNIQAVAASQLEISNDYYQSVLRQAKQSFRAAIAAATVGLAFFLAALGFGIVRDSLGAAIISSISGAIVEVIAGLNFWLFGQTAKQLDLFHVRLEQTQRFLLANSVCENLGDGMRDAARSQLVSLIGQSSPELPPDQGK